MSRGRNLLRELEWDMTLAPFTSLGIIMGPWSSWAAGRGRSYEWGWGMHPMWGLWGVWGIGMVVMMLMVWGVVIAGIVVAIRWMVSHDRALRPSDGGPRRLPALSLSRRAATMWPPLTVPSVSEAST